MSWLVGLGLPVRGMGDWLLLRISGKSKRSLRLRPEETSPFGSCRLVQLQIGLMSKFIHNLPVIKGMRGWGGQVLLGYIEPSKQSPLEFAREVVKETHRYNGFNLIVADFISESMVYVTNRPKGSSGFMSKVSPGLHVLSNASLDSPWPKAQRLRDGFKELLDRHGHSELPAKEMACGLMMSTIKDEDQSLLPGIYPPEFEFPASSVFVDFDSPLGRYGTRSTSAVYVKLNREVSFFVRNLEKEAWKEEVVTFSIEAD
ncbi:hypothetical protein CDL15_Pgr019787 [Punica granatum]|uniref:Transport and Golgi organization protein 2 homolog n=1 Tax=Punica granatum TaxID=22663 RepID=A0A218X6C3_PUNGR|nr:hypothetical protein CDL15_Pgr019787 [Punica granatum]